MSLKSLIFYSILYFIQKVCACVCFINYLFSYVLCFTSYNVLLFFVVVVEDVLTVF